ncbi:hypothetical protein [Pleurocapsa sp. FMAR1]
MFLAALWFLIHFADYQSTLPVE